MSVLALIPARSGSKGIKDKNSRVLGGHTLIERAVYCAMLARIEKSILTTDIGRFFEPHKYQWGPEATGHVQVINRPPALAQDDTPMIDVVTHALREIPGPPDQIIVLLQPTQPFRTPAHVKAAIALLQQSGADSVVSVVELPKTHSPELLMTIWHEPYGNGLVPWPIAYHDVQYEDVPTRRQDARSAYMRDGTCYVFRRKTVAQYGTIYGRSCLPLIIPPDESCELDTEADWAEVVRRWEARAVGVK